MRHKQLIYSARIPVIMLAGRPRWRHVPATHVRRVVLVLQRGAAGHSVHSCRQRCRRFH